MTRKQNATPSFIAYDLNGSANIDRQTDKAVLVFGFGWFPKSQVRFLEAPCGVVFVIPKWLWRKSGLSYFDAYGRRIGFEMDEAELMKYPNISEDVYATS